MLVRQPHFEQMSFGSCEQINYSMRKPISKSEKIKTITKISYPQGGETGIAKVDFFSVSL